MEKKHWWQCEPWRMVQTNLRETDMADLDAEKFAQELEDFGATVVTLNAGGILASYPSKLPYHTVSAFLTGSSLKEILEACHRHRLRVIARMDFSKIPEAVYRQHKEWAFRTADGGIVSQNGFVQTCQNGEYQQEKTLEILKELLSTHPFDGVYCNMSGFVATDYSGKVYGLCTCNACRQAFREETGLNVPKTFDWTDPVMMRYMDFQARAAGKLRMKMNAAVKAIDSEIAMDKVDYLRTESHTDVGEPIWIYSASSNSRQTAGGKRQMLSDNASVDFMAFRYRESSVSPGVMELRQWQNLANSGNVSVYLMGRLDNHRDKSFYEATRRVFQFHKKHEKLLAGLESGAEVLLTVKSRQSRLDPESYGWIRALTASHIPFDEVKASGLCESSLKGKRTVILADVGNLTEKQGTLLDAFARDGGTVVASGSVLTGGDGAGLGCMGIKKLCFRKKNLQSTAFLVTPQETDVFRRCEKAPVLASGPEVVFAEYEDGSRRYLHMLPEPMFGPPELCYAKEETDDPGAVVTFWGRGKGIFIPWNCGSFYHNEGYDNTLNFMQDVLFELCGLPQIAPSLHPSVELVLNKKENRTVISLINGSGYFGNSFFEPVPMRALKLQLPGQFVCGRALNGGVVTLQPESEATVIMLDILNHFEMIELEETFNEKH